MPISKDELSTNAMGGTELMKYELERRLPEELLNEAQIIVSRVRELDPTKIRIFYAHDLPGDPESEFLRNPQNIDKFHKLVFVSNWQMQAYINEYRLPWSKCTVIKNAINPIDAHDKPKDTIRLVYFSTPHRGLNILLPVFEKLAEEYDNIELDVFSSFSLYGWSERDEPYEALFERCRVHPKINYHGAVANDVIREHLKTAHILAYPSIWPETSCLVLMEAMSAGLLCVHSNFAALPETAANWTSMYQFNENMVQHANVFYAVLKNAIDTYWEDDVQSKLQSQKSYSNIFYNWNARINEWEALIASLLDAPRGFPQEYFSYKAG